MNLQYVWYMMPTRSSLRIVLLLFFSFILSNAAAQPTLPDIAGSADKGIVILSWICQYKGVKNITVMRTTDSLNYIAIGHVKNTGKGVQAFVDGHPAAGRNLYKLVLIFSTGLKWSGNIFGIYVDKATIGKSQFMLPENDSLQRYIITEDFFSPALPDTIAGSILKNEKSRVKNNTKDKDSALSARPKINMSFGDEKDANVYIDKGNPAVDSKHKVSVSFDRESSHTGNDSMGHAQKKKILISFEEPDAATTTFIKSRFVFIDPLTGNVDVNLPDDVRTHHYSVKFYDDQDHIVIEVPKINGDRIIIDKRNFQRRGIYKFILRKDVTELETGYIKNTNP